MYRRFGKHITALFVAMAMLFCMAPVTLAADPAAFQNGPYLLAPKTTSMVVVWESTEKTTATIAYGTEATALGTPVAVEADATAPEYQGTQLNLFHYKFDNLKPDTRYYYEVKLASGATCKASFKTLSDDPKQVNIISLSDSHIFATRPEINTVVKKYDPDFILHCGDMVEGTGSQTEQFTFWFQGETDDDFIHNYPVVYASGNHDQGGTYFEAYVYDIQDAEYGAEVKGDSSFNYAGIHIVTMNSNPWGLFQLNSEATGGTADPTTLKEIENAQNWLKKDLATDAAKNAEFRLVMMHHPASDAYTARYIPAIIEPAGVNLMIAGHTHVYARAVSNDPAIGAGTIYLTHQDARTYNAKGDFFHITGTPGDGVLTVEDYGAADASSESQINATTKVAAKTQQFSFSDVSITPDSVLCNGDVTVKATITNTGKGLAAASLPVSDNGTTRYLYKFDGAIKTLDPGESATLTGTLTMETQGTHTLKLGDVTKTVEVKFRPATYEYDNLRIKQGTGDEYDINSNVIHVKADVKNIGNESGSVMAACKIDGKTVASQGYTLTAGQTKTAEFTYTFEKAGTYQVTIGDAAAETVYIEGSIQGMPIVKDQSGNNNDGYIHGAPELGTDDQGHQTLILDGKRDYIEVPDKGGYHVDDAVSGMVWANLPSAGTTKGGVSELLEPYADGKGAIPDHNPLIMKGISIGWGTPYLFRIAVRETGKVTYGVCLNDDNGEFQWNDGSEDAAGIKKDTWVQYTSSFDFLTGGDSYENGYHSAHVDKPAFKASIKNWEGSSLYVGLGFKNTLFAGRGRGMYHTMLPGAVSQLRFYTNKVTAEENDAVRNNPTEAGASAANLKIWLNFESANINTTGSHTTEWVAATAAPTKLAYDAALKGAASITAVVQTSDDQNTIKEEKEIKLTNGTNTAAVSGLAQAKYVRIKTTFVSDLNKTDTCLPVLNEYVLTAGTEKCWNTLTDWNKGTYTGAAAHQSGDAYRDYTKDFDDYSGTADKPDFTGFTDIANHWAKDAIEYVAGKGLFNGTSATTFSPDVGMSRAMFVTVLGRAASAPTNATQNKFTDVAANTYYAPYVAWAIQNDIVKGVSDTQFAPTALITREQMATMMVRYLEKQNASYFGSAPAKSTFADADKISDYAVSAVAKMQASSLIQGKGNNLFVPQGTTTRAETATILQRMLQKNGG